MMSRNKPLIEAQLDHRVIAKTERNEDGMLESFYVVPFISNYTIRQPQTVGYDPTKQAFMGVDPKLSFAFILRGNKGIDKAKETIEKMGVEALVGKDDLGNTYVRGHFPILDYYKNAGANVSKHIKALNPLGIGLATIFAMFERELGGDMLESTLSYRLTKRTATLNQPGNYSGFLFSSLSCRVMRRAINKIKAGMDIK